MTLVALAKVAGVAVEEEEDVDDDDVDRNEGITRKASLLILRTPKREENPSSEVENNLDHF